MNFKFVLNELNLRKYFAFSKSHKISFKIHKTVSGMTIAKNKLVVVCIHILIFPKYVSNLSRLLN